MKNIEKKKKKRGTRSFSSQSRRLTGRIIGGLTSHYAHFPFSFYVQNAQGCLSHCAMEKGLSLCGCTRDPFAL